MMVQSLIKNPNSMVPSSHFRRACAAQSLAIDPQMKLKLFPDEYEDIIDISKPPFAMHVHGPDGRDKSRPAFAYIVFPDNNYQTYVHEIN